MVVGVQEQGDILTTDKKSRYGKDFNLDRIFEFCTYRKNVTGCGSKVSIMDLQVHLTQNTRILNLFILNYSILRGITKTVYMTHVERC